LPGEILYSFVEEKKWAYKKIINKKEKREKGEGNEIIKGY